MTLAGDGRADSPGYSAKFGSYSIIELTCNRIVDFKLVQVKLWHTRTTIIAQQNWGYMYIYTCMYNVFFLFKSNEVGGSYHMENEGLKRVLEYLKEMEVHVSVLVTDVNS